MTDEPKKDWRQTLWVDEKKHDALLEQYRLYVESSFHVSNWRIAANTLFLSLAALLFGGFAFLLNQDPMPKPLVVTAWIAGLFLCYQWLSLILQYKNLNTAKFAVIHEMERHLAVAPFDAEWVYVEEGKNAKRYFPVSHIEGYMPIVIAIAESIVAIYGLCG